MKSNGSAKHITWKAKPENMSIYTVHTRGVNLASRLRACSYGGEPACLPAWPGRRDSFHLVFIWRNSSPLAETEI